MELVSGLEQVAVGPTPEMPAKRGRGRPRKIESARAEFSASASSSPAIAAFDAPRPARVRKPFGTQVQKLAYPERPGYRNYWFADHPGRIVLAKEAGYEHVVDRGGTPVSYPGGVNPAGGILTLYLMEIPKEYYQEDIQAQQDLINDRERGIKRGADNNGEPGQDGRYIPSQGISIKLDAKLT